MARRYVMCPKCATRNERTGGRRYCVSCRAKLPARRVPVHARTLRDDPYPVYEAVNAELHAGAFGGEWSADCCGVCGKPPSQDRKHDRDHDHKTGARRGLACGGNRGCNVLMLPWITPATARAIATAKLEAGESDAGRWVQIAGYLERVEAAERVTGRV